MIRHDTSLNHETILSIIKRQTLLADAIPMRTVQLGSLCDFVYQNQGVADKDDATRVASLESGKLRSFVAEGHEMS